MAEDGLKQFLAMVKRTEEMARKIHDSSHTGPIQRCPVKLCRYTGHMCYWSQRLDENSEKDFKVSAKGKLVMAVPADDKPAVTPSEKMLEGWLIATAEAIRHVREKNPDALSGFKQTLHETK